MTSSVSKISGNSGVSVQGAYGIELYIKGGTDYYRLMCVYKPKDSDYDVTRIYSSDFVENQNLFIFTLTPKAGEIGATYIPSELSFDDLFTNDPVTDFSGSEIYIKNNSPIHRYINNNGHSSYINTRKPYLYFGKLYPKDPETNTISVETYFMKDYALDSLPEHQRTDNLREFFGVAFDELYSQVYYKIRNILSLSDPYETSDEYLQYLLETYGTSTIVPASLNTRQLDRFFINNLPALLKRKGTYNVLYGIFRFLTNTANRLNIYEQWHELLPSGAPYPYSDIETYCVSAGYRWEEHLYSEYYADYGIPSNGAGTRYYTNEHSYPVINGPLKLSPHYRVEFDLSTAPVKSNKIIDEETYDIIYEKFEELRPVARVSEYSTVIALPTDFTGKKLDTYNSNYQAFARTHCLRPIYSPLSGDYIFSNRSLTATTINIHHDLETRDVLVQLYKNENINSVVPYTRFIPKNIIVIDENNIMIELSVPQQFYAFITSILSAPAPRTIIEVTNFPEDVLTESTDNSSVITIWNEKTNSNYRYEIYPTSHRIQPSTFEHAVDIPAPSGSNDKYYEVSLSETWYTPTPVTGQTTYTFTHLLRTPGVVVELFEMDLSDLHLEKVMAADVTITNRNVVTVKVADSSKTYVGIVRKLTTWPFLKTSGDLIDECDHILLGTGDSISIYNPASTTNGLLKTPIVNDGYTGTDYKNNHSERYEQKSFVVYDIGVDGFDTYNIKVVIDVKENINITEVGIFDPNEKMIFYTACSEIFAKENTKVILYFSINRDTIPSRE